MYIFFPFNHTQTHIPDTFLFIFVYLITRLKHSNRKTGVNNSNHFSYVLFFYIEIFCWFLHHCFFFHLKKKILKSYNISQHCCTDTQEKIKNCFYPIFSSKLYKFKTCLKHKTLFAWYTKMCETSMWKGFYHFESHAYFIIHSQVCRLKDCKFYQNTIYLKWIWKKLEWNIYATKETTSGKTHHSVPPNPPLYAGEVKPPTKFLKRGGAWQGLNFERGLLEKRG